MIFFLWNNKNYPFSVVSIYLYNKIWTASTLWLNMIYGFMKRHFQFLNEFHDHWFWNFKWSFDSNILFSWSFCLVKIFYFIKYFFFFFKHIIISILECWIFKRLGKVFSWFFFFFQRLQMIDKISCLHIFTKQIRIWIFFDLCDWTKFFFVARKTCFFIWFYF